MPNNIQEQLNDFDACFNQGNIYYMVKNDPVAASKCYKKAVALNPENINAQIGLALSYLKMKNYKEGWKYFESRNSFIMQGASDLIKPLWLGEPIQDKILYVYYEAGFGDTIMFARFLPLLKNKCKKVLFMPQPECLKLFEDSQLGVEVLSQNICPSDFDFHIPMRSLPYALKVSTEVTDDKYLKADLSKVEVKKYFDNNDFKIGINWQGNSGDIKRKIPLKSFYKLFDLPKTKIYSLQVGEGSQQLAGMENIIDLGSTFNDFSDTAAAVENLDLIISNDTSVAHLAGALGKNCWVLLPFVSDWRWGVDRTCSWYKSLKLFRQKDSGNWDDPFAEVYEELKKMSPLQKP